MSRSAELSCSDASAGSELCNGLDDDCDGQVDEVASLVDDVENCGECGNACDFSSAAAACVGGQCVIQSCERGFSNVDEKAENGCEHECREVESCDEVDDDCDGEIDEDTDGLECETGMHGACGTGKTSCEEGRITCEVANGPTDEICGNDVDDDCDGSTDEQCELPTCIRDDFDDHTYSFCAEARNWVGARNGCAALGAHLVTITGETENIFVATIAHSIMGTTSWWMGLNDRARENTFVWDDGSEASFFAWFGKEPNDGPKGSTTGEDCGAVPEHTILSWNDADCESLKPFICEEDTPSDSPP